jgi:hypothetical protein
MNSSEKVEPKNASQDISGNASQDISGNASQDISGNTNIICELKKDSSGNYIDVNGNIVKFYVILY